MCKGHTIFQFSALNLSKIEYSMVRNIVNDFPYKREHNSSGSNQGKNNGGNCISEGLRAKWNNESGECSKVISIFCSTMRCSLVKCALPAYLHYISSKRQNQKLVKLAFTRMVREIANDFDYRKSIQHVWE